MAPIFKTELFDADMLQRLSTKDGIDMDTRKKLIKYRRMAINGNEVRITYDFSKNMKGHQLGRLYPDPFIGLATFWNEIRAALAEKYYWDVDMVNAQPNILRKLGEKYGISVTNLAHYCANREAILEEISIKHTFTRYEAKEVCIAVMFGGWRDHHPVLPLIYPELVALAVELSKQFPDDFNAVKKSKDVKEGKDLYSSFLSYFAQNEERKILKIIDNFMNTNGRSMDVLIYDGGHVRKLPDEIEFPKELLRAAEEHILKETGFDIQLAVKPLKHTFVFDDEKEVLLPPSVTVDDAYAANVLVKLAGDRLRKAGGAIWVKDSEGVWGNDEMALRQLVAEFRFKLLFKQYDPTSGISIKKYNYGGCEHNIVNMLKQLNVYAHPGELPIQLHHTLVETESENTDVLNLFLELVDINCNHHPELKTYYLDYLAHMLQKPLEKPDVALVITGKKGYGKDTLFRLIGEYIVGSQFYVNYTDNKQFFDKHDVLKAGKLLVKVEEADPRVFMPNASSFKASITSPTLTINPKGKTPTSIPNIARYILTSNNGIPIEVNNGERRFVILNCSGEKKDNHDYWNYVYSTLGNDEAGKLIANWLLRRDITQFNPRKLPKNEHQETVMEAVISAEERFINDWSGEWTSANDLYRMYRQYCDENSYKALENAIHFGKKLAGDFDGKVMRKRRSTGFCYCKPGCEDGSVAAEGL